MKKILLCACVLLLLPFTSGAQIIFGGPMDSTVISFTSDSTSGIIPDTAAMPLWQVGRTHKPFFTTDSAGAIAMMTDTLGPYPVNANNWFEIRVPKVFNTIIDFWHKYQTDSAHDGGIVEFSTDHGTTWQNVMGACAVDSESGLPGVLTAGFYAATDTLITGEPAFNGSSSGQQYSRFQFYDGGPPRVAGGSGCGWTLDTFYIRFRFVSDPVADSLAGWEIDSIKTEETNYFVSVKNIAQLNSLDPYPNPSYDGIFTFPAIENEQDYTTEVYNAMGQKICTLPYSRSLDIGQYAKGVYFYRVSDGTAYYSGQLQVE